MAGHDVAQYRRIADELAAQIARRRITGRLPTEHELAERYQVNRQTARAAIQQLEGRHLVRRSRGRGTFVTRRLDYVISPTTPPSWTETVRQAGGTPRQETELVRRQSRPSTRLRELLELQPGEQVLRVSRLRFVDDELAACSDSCFNLALVPDFDRVAATGGSLFAALATEYRLDPVRGWSEASLEVPPQAVVRRLGLTGRPLLHRHRARVDCARLRRPVEFTTVWLRPDLIRLVFRLGESNPPLMEEDLP